MKSVPEKLKEDCILEALLEVRFSSNDIPEGVVGTLSRTVSKEDYSVNRLPIADLPLALRESEPSLHYQPHIEFRSNDGTTVYKIGPNVLSWHCLKSYPGWDIFFAKQRELVDLLFKEFSDVRIQRVGLRYINVLEKERHKLDSINGLDLSISLEGREVTDSFTVNVSQQVDDNTSVTIRIASPELVSGSLPTDAVAFVDVDVYSAKGAQLATPTDVCTWVESAHEIEKSSFFGLLPQALIDELAN